MGDIIQFREPKKRRQNVYYLSSMTSMTMEHFLKGEHGVFTVTPDGVATLSIKRAPESIEIDRWPGIGINWWLLGGIIFSLAIEAALIEAAIITLSSWRI